jgi:hypothetical protein
VAISALVGRLKGTSSRKKNYPGFERAMGGLSKSSQGNSEQQGGQLKQNAGLHRAILDQGWGNSSGNGP